MNGILNTCMILFIASISFSQVPDTLWTKMYNPGDWDHANSILQTADNGFIIAGYTDFWEPDLWVIKTDQNGDMQWEIFKGDFPRFYIGETVLITSDGGYIVSAITGTSGNDTDISLIKLDCIGNIEQEVLFDIGPSDYVRESQHTSDGGHIHGGSTADQYNRDFMLLKTDSEYNIEWVATTGGDRIEYCYSVQQTSDGGYIAAGSTESYGAGACDAYLVKTDSSGNVEWEAYFGGSENDYAKAVGQTQDGGYIIVGYTYSWNNPNDLYVVKTDCEGNMEWDLVLDHGSYEIGFSFVEISDGGYIITGQRTGDFWLLKVDNIGNVIWETAIGLQNMSECGYALQQTVDGGYIVAGCRNTDVGELDLWLVKFESGLGISDYTQPDIGLQISEVFPNPFISSLQISCFLPASGKMNLSVYDIAGRFIENLENSAFSAGEHTFVWNPDPLLPSGCYMLVLDALGEQYAMRCVKI